MKHFCDSNPIPLTATRLLIVGLLAFCGTSVSFECLTAQDSTTVWSEFRGNAGTGQAIGADLPTDFGDESIVIWKTAVHGKGWSSPVVWNDQVWLTTATPDGKKMSVLCFDLESGEIIRDDVLHQNENPAFCHSTNSYASPTPAIEQDRVYVHFGSYGTTCLDTKTGQQIWQRTDLECDHFRGPASSPILFEDLLIVAFDGFDQQYVVALDKATGKTVWKRPREINYGTPNGDLKKAYGTGGVFDVGGEPLLIYPSAIATVAYRPKTGETVWTAYHEGMNASSRPAKTKEGLIVVANGMGKMVAINPDGKGNVTDQIAWSLSKSVIKKPSPLIINEHLFMISDKGIASCVKTSDGQIVWQERVGGKFAASPIFDGEHIFAFDESGKIHAFKPASELGDVKTSKLGDGFRGTPAVVGNKMILRSLSHLYCVSKQPKQ